MMAIRRGIRRPAFDPWFAALLIVFIAALAVRLYGIDWDDGADLHPDELFIAKIVLIDRIHLDWPIDVDTLRDPARSGLNPRSVDPTTGKFREFAYGALPLFVTDSVAWVLSRVTGTDWNAMDRLFLVGRAISAALSALTVLPIAALGSSLGGRSVGLLAALFAALAPTSIQLAHFFTTDSWLTLFVALCLVASVAAAKTGGTTRFAIAGFAFGLAMATKGSVFALGVPLLASLAVDARRRIADQELRQAWRVSVSSAAAALATTCLAFFAFEPFALVRPDVYLHSLRVQADIVSGAFDVPFTRVYAGTVPFLYQLDQFFWWGYGPVAGALAICGIGMLMVLALRRRAIAPLILTTWIVAYGGVILLSDVKFLRYLEPLAPVLAVGAALALSRLSAFVANARWAPIRRAVPVVALGLSLVWTGAFLSIYAHEHPRLTASRWLYASVPPGSTLTAEYWDDALPRTLDYALSPSSFGFESILLDLYRDQPPREASQGIYDGISGATYIIQSSERVEAAVAAAPWRYPVQGRFFTQLKRNAGALGFKRVATFERAPSVGIVAIDDRGADESFVNYDHPRVAVYQRSQPSSRADYDDVMAWSLKRPWYPTREPPAPTLLLDGPVGENPAVSDARWSAAVTRQTPAALAVWLVLLVSLLAIGRPIARLLLPATPDEGWGLARTLALMLAAYPVWLGASFERFRFRAVWVVVAMLAVGATGYAIAYLLRRTSQTRPESRLHPPKAANRVWIHAEVVFWVVFSLFLILRFLNPDGWHPFWGGEKAMEFAQINAIQRSAYFPPYDPWFADGYLNYYYFGFYLMAFLFKATGIPSEIGFNLALPTVMGLVASGGFSAAAALARGLTRSPRLALLGGWLGAGMLCLIGNLSAIRGIAAGGAAGSDPFLFWTWSGSRAIQNAITEFPYFSGLYADLHSHVIALPITLATIALCVAIATSEPFAKSDAAGSATKPRALLAARLTVVSLLLGSLSATNAWDVPVYAILTLTSIFMATMAASSWRRRLAAFVSLSILTVGGAWLLFLPFHRHFVALFGQLALVRDPTDLIEFMSHLGGLVATSVLGLTVLLLNEYPNRWTVLWPWLALATVSVAIVAIVVGPPAIEPAGQLALVVGFVGPPIAAAWLNLARQPSRRAWDAQALRGALIVAALSAILCVFAERPVFGLLLALGLVSGVSWICLKRRPERFACLLVAAGYLTAAGAELVVVADDLIGTPAYRMNTVFKFYNQVWVLLALSAAALLTLMIREAAPRRRVAFSSRSTLRQEQPWARFGVAASALLILASLTYPVLATGPRLAQQVAPRTGPRTLNALAWMESGTVAVSDDAEFSHIGYAGDAPAIDWFFMNVTSSPVIAEASIGPYRCNGSRIASATGLPTIIGWERHEQQQRYADSLPERVADVRTLYTSGDPVEKTTILRRYNVEYVVVGDVER
ncbi:MAG: glycosyltransferase family 39 protein, partial [Chloroflexia bacterium]|nr:glycosyltransferase family 39 protein [Chloroflexia bacterium]